MEMSLGMMLRPTAERSAPVVCEWGGWGGGSAPRRPPTSTLGPAHPQTPTTRSLTDSDRTQGAKRTNDPPDANFVAEMGGNPAALPPSPPSAECKNAGSVRWKRGRKSSPAASLARWPRASSMTRPSAVAAAVPDASFWSSTWDKTAAQLLWRRAWGGGRRGRRRNSAPFHPCASSLVPLSPVVVRHLVGQVQRVLHDGDLVFGAVGAEQAAAGDGRLRGKKGAGVGVRLAPPAPLPRLHTPRTASSSDEGVAARSGRGVWGGNEAGESSRGAAPSERHPRLLRSYRCPPARTPSRSG